MAPVNHHTTVSSPADASTARQTPSPDGKAVFSAYRLTGLVVLVTLIGAVIRIYRLSARSFWIDEAASAYFATMPFWSFLKLLWLYQGNMTLYYFLLRGWVHLGDSEFAVRSLSVLFGILAIPTVYVLGSRLFDRSTGLIASCLLSVHSFHVAFSQEARSYSLLVFLLVLATYVLVLAMESDHEAWRWLLFAFSAAFCVYAHIFAVLVLAAHAFVILFPRPYRVRLGTAAMAAFAFGILVAPMAAFVLLHHSDQISWVPQPALGEVIDFLRLLTGEGGILLMVAYLVLAGAAFWRREEGEDAGKQNWSLRLLGLWLVLPPALTLLASAIKPIFFPRYMVMCVPALVILAARGIVKMSRIPAVKNWAAAAALVLVLSMSAWGTRQYFANLSNETSDWRSAVAYILSHQRPGDGIVFYIPNSYAYRYYAHRAESQHQVTAVPDILYPAVNWRPISHAEVEGDIRGRSRVWLILHMESLDSGQEAVIRSTLNERLHVEDKRSFPGQDLITVELFSSGRGDAPQNGKTISN